MKYCFIGFGKIYSLHLYILYCLIFKLLGEFIYTFNSIKEEDNYGIFSFSPVLNEHCIIKHLYMYIGYIICSIIFYYIVRKKKDFEKGVVEDEQFKIKYLHNKAILKAENIKKDIFIICLIFVFYQEIIDIIYNFGLSKFDFWIFHIFFTIYFMEIYFHIKHYNHQLYSLIFIFITNIIFLYISTFINEENGNSYVIVKKLFKTKYLSILFF